MSRFDWSDERNAVLEQWRGVRFEDVVVSIQNGGVIDVIEHSNRARYPSQSIIVLDVEGHVWLVPCVKASGVRYLKTIIPGRITARAYRA